MPLPCPHLCINNNPNVISPRKSPLTCPGGLRAFPLGSLPLPWATQCLASGHLNVGECVILTFCAEFSSVCFCSLVYEPLEIRDSILFILFTFVFLESCQSLDGVWRVPSSYLITDGKHFNALKTTQTGPLPEDNTTLKLFFHVKISQDTEAKSSQINMLPCITYACPPASGYSAGERKSVCDLQRIFASTYSFSELQETNWRDLTKHKYKDFHKE